MIGKKVKKSSPRTRLLIRLIRDEDLNRTDLRVGCYLVARASFETLKRFRQKRIGEFLSVAANHVGVSLATLVEHGYLERDASRKSHRYRLLHHKTKSDD